LDLQIKSGDWDKDKETYVINNYFDKIPNYDCKFSRNLKDEKIIEQLSQEYQNLSGKKRNEAKQDFIDLMKMTKPRRVTTFGNILFAVKFQEMENCPEGVNFSDR